MMTSPICLAVSNVPLMSPESPLIGPGLLICSAPSSQSSYLTRTEPPHSVISLLLTLTSAAPPVLSVNLPPSGLSLTIWALAYPLMSSSLLPETLIEPVTQS